jgi:hypothetical protein
MVSRRSRSYIEGELSRRGGRKPLLPLKSSVQNPWKRE